jgi:hypothetical protein
LRRKAVLLRHALRSTGQAHGGPAPLRGRSEGVCPPPAPPIVCHASVRAVPAPTERRQRLAQERHEPVPAWRVPAGVAALQARRGVPCPVAVTMVAALGALPRLATPRARRPCLGLIPAAYASGERRHQGAITPAGPPPARRALVAGAWASRSPAKVRRHGQRRLAPQPTMSQDSSWHAHVRLGQRSRHLVARSHQATSVTVALARALAGVMGTMAQQLPVAASASKDRIRLAPQRRRLPTCLSRGAAPGWCHPRQRSEARRGHASRDRGRHPTEARQVGAKTCH